MQTEVLFFHYKFFQWQHTCKPDVLTLMSL